MSLREITSPEVFSQYRAWSDDYSRPDTYEHLCLGESDYQICVKIINSKEEVVSTKHFDTKVNADDWLNDTVESINAEVANELKALT